MKPQVKTEQKQATTILILVVIVFILSITILGVLFGNNPNL
jgi:hypothetical protein